MRTSDNPFGQAGWTPERLGSLRGKTYVITGANAGAGFEATRALLRKEASVVMLCRNPQKAAAAIAALKDEHGPEAQVRCVHLDLASLEAVRESAAEVLQRVPHIDALICNAAIAQVARQRLTVDGFESQLGVNHYGHFLLTGLLYERIEASKGRIVVVGSMGYAMGAKRIQFDDMNWDKNYNPMATYGASKLAQMIFGYELQRRVRARGSAVQVHVCHPGAARTELGMEEGNLMTRFLFRVLGPVLGQSAEKGSWPEVLCATEDGLLPEKFYGPTRRGNTGGPVGETHLQPHALDRDTANRLWALSEQETGLAWTP